MNWFFGNKKFKNYYLNFSFSIANKIFSEKGKSLRVILQKN